MGHGAWAGRQVQIATQGLVLPFRESIPGLRTSSGLSVSLSSPRRGCRKWLQRAIVVLIFYDSIALWSLGREPLFEHPVKVGDR